MPQLMTHPPHTAVEPIEETFHGVIISDPYRWFEDQESPRTRAWIAAQRRYARAYLDAIPGRDRIRGRIRELVDVETYDSIQRVGDRYFFRKRLHGQEQPCIYVRDGSDGEDRVLVDPAQGAGKFSAVKPLRVSTDGRLLLYEIKEGGERTGIFALLDIENGNTLPDVLPRGYLRGFAFAPDCKSFHYVHEALDAKRPLYRAAYHHVLGTQFGEDREVFSAGEGEKIRLGLTSGKERLAFFVSRFRERTLTDIYLKSFAQEGPPQPILLGTT